jgi:TonB family protein
MRALVRDADADGRDVYLSNLQRPGDGRIFARALVLAVAVHVVFLFVDLPRSKRIPVPTPTTQSAPAIRDIDLMPPPIRQPRTNPTRSSVRLIPVAEPELDLTDPLIEPSVPVPPPDFDSATFEPRIEQIAPPPSDPRITGSDGVTNPTLIADSQVRPDYPEPARQARLQGNVILEAIIRADGTVGEISVLRCTQPHAGFEEAAIDAVRQWLYEPATQNGRPVDVYFTVVVEFQLY